MRVSEEMKLRSFLRNLEDVRANLFEQNKQVSSGKKLTRPSEGPVESGRVLRIRDEISRINQYYRNLQQARVKLGTAVDSLNSIRNLINKAFERGAYGISATLDQTARDAVALEIQEVLNEIVRIAGTNIDGKKIFSGSQIGTEPLALVGGSYIYQGDAGSQEIEIAPDHKIQVNVAGSQIFTEADTDLLNSMGRLIDALQTSDIDTARQMMDKLEQGGDVIDGSSVTLSTSLAQLDGSKHRLDDQMLRLTGELSQLEDANLADAISRLVQGETTLKATLSAGSRLNQLNLFDILG